MDLMLVIAGGILIAAAVVAIGAAGMSLYPDEHTEGVGCILMLAALAAAAAVIYFALQLAPQLPRP